MLIDMHSFSYLHHTSTSTNDLKYRYPLSGLYIRQLTSPYDSGGMGGQIRLIVNKLDNIFVEPLRLDTEDGGGTIPLDTSLSRIRIEKITWNKLRRNIMLTKFDDIIEITLHHEGGYVNSANDLGGETNFNISFYISIQT